ncbi:MAG: hypothetical protein CBD21_04345 [bacterium TMED161]|nr:MAG: hypothetical protein CBD21_04345 [bacterium TMED161]|tara:strand:- start:5473 stop:6387 length:915 start_codon:yes stop_codon:yes gene_type:complete
MDFLLFILGSVLIFYGSSLLIDNSTLIARSLNISPIVIGLTVIAFGTSLPELVVSIIAISRGEGAIVLGNIVGSNIANILLVLGVIVIIKPLDINFSSLKQGSIYLLIATCCLLIMILTQELSYIPGFILLFLFCIYMISQFKNTKDNDFDSSISKEDFKFLYILYIILGSIVLGYGSHLFINSSIQIASFFNVPKIVISVSLVAFGTSVPELVTSIVAVRKGEPDFVIGNIIGSNIINIFLVLGSSLIISDIYVTLLGIFYPSIFMIISALLLLLLLLLNNRMNRTHGFLLFILYLTFIYLTL